MHNTNFQSGASPVVRQREKHCIIMYFRACHACGVNKEGTIHGRI